MNHKTRCICVDKDKKSRDTIERLVKETMEVRLIRSYASLEPAAAACIENNAHILIIRLDESPISDKDMSILNRLLNNGTQLIVLSHKMGVIREIIPLAVDFIILPTSLRRLRTALLRAIRIKSNPVAQDNRGINGEFASSAIAH